MSSLVHYDLAKLFPYQISRVELALAYAIFWSLKQRGATLQPGLNMSLHDRIYSVAREILTSPVYIITQLIISMHQGEIQFRRTVQRFMPAIIFRHLCKTINVSHSQNQPPDFITYIAWMEHTRQFAVPSTIAALSSVNDELHAWQTFSIKDALQELWVEYFAAHCFQACLWIALLLT